MHLFPTKRLIPKAKIADGSASQTSSGDGVGRGMEFAIVLAAFLGIGFGLDSWLGTKPVFMIALSVLALVGQFASMWYGYDARMKLHEAERAAKTTGSGRQGKASVS